MIRRKCLFLSFDEDDICQPTVTTARISVVVVVVVVVVKEEGNLSKKPAPELRNTTSPFPLIAKCTLALLVAFSATNAMKATSKTDFHFPHLILCSFDLLSLLLRFIVVFFLFFFFFSLATSPSSSRREVSFLSSALKKVMMICSLNSPKMRDFITNSHRCEKMRQRERERDTLTHKSARLLIASHVLHRTK